MVGSMGPRSAGGPTAGDRRGGLYAQQEHFTPVFSRASMRGTIDDVNVNDTSRVRTSLLTNPKLRSITRCPHPFRIPYGMPRWREATLTVGDHHHASQWTSTLVYVDCTTYGPKTHGTPTKLSLPPNLPQLSVEAEPCLLPRLYVVRRRLSVHPGQYIHNDD